MYANSRVYDVVLCSDFDNDCAHGALYTSASVQSAQAHGALQSQRNNKTTNWKIRY